MNQLNKLRDHIADNFRPLFLILIIGFLITGSLDLQNAYLLKTPDLPTGTFSWEINTSDSLQRAVLKTWSVRKDTLSAIKKDRIEPVPITAFGVMISETKADYGFILCYMGLFWLFLARLSWSRPKKVTGIEGPEARAWAAATLLAGILDGVENFWTIHTINRYHDYEFFSAKLVAYPAIAKWILVLLIAIRLLVALIKLDKPKLWLEEFTTGLGKLIGYAWRFRVVLITLLVFVLVFFISDQGQDLLITINSDRWACGLFLGTTSVLALLCWHLPKAMDNAKHLSFAQFWLGPVDFEKESISPNPPRPGGKVDVGRLFGAAAFLVPAAGILHTMQVYQIYYSLQNIPPLVLLGAILLLYTLALRHHWVDWLFKSGDKVNWWSYGIVMVVLLGAVVFLGRDDDNTEPYFLAYLALDLILLSAAFLITTTLRTCVPEVENWPVAPWITFGGLLLALFFVACNFSGFLRHWTDGARFYTMPLVFCGVAGYLLLASLLLFFGKKTGITFITLVMAFSLYKAIHSVTTYHNAALVTTSARPAPELRVYAREWLMSRRAEIDSFYRVEPHQDYPVFFVNAYGGGIRAAVWTTMVMGTMDSLALRQRREDGTVRDFRHYVFSMSGASGGTIGLSLLTAARAAYQDALHNDTFLYPWAYKKVYPFDYLSADVTALLGRDMLASTFGLSKCWPDRGRLMEEDWERQLCTQGLEYGAPLHSLWKAGRYDLPLLFANTYDVDLAKKGIAAPVTLDSLDFPSVVLIAQELRGKDDLRLSTAAFLSARFPYVSPTAKLCGRHHFTDGGTWDNSGGETSLQVLQVLRRELDTLVKHDTVFRHVRLCFLSIPTSIRQEVKVREEKNIFEPMSPVKGILASVDGHAYRSDSVNAVLKKRAGYGYYSIRPTREEILDSGRRIAPVLPLGWQISDYALKELAASATAKTQLGFDSLLVAIGLKERSEVGKKTKK